jgi:excisionase family DNA binding protein
MEYPDILNSKQAQQYMGICETTLYRLIYEGKIKPFKVGRSYRFSRRKLEELVYQSGELAQVK